MAIDIGGALGGIGSFLGNMVTSSINSSRAWKYTQRAMNLQDSLNRAYTRDSYGLMREGLQKAGYNPLLALGSSANSSIYSGSSINSDSDNGSQAITSAIDSKRFKDEHAINEATKEKIDAETENIKLDNRKKNSELITSPRQVLSDLIDGKDSPITRVIRPYFKKLGVDLSSLKGHSAKSSNNITVKLHNDKPYVQKGVPRSVVRSFNSITSNSAKSSQKHYSEVSSWNNKNQRYKVEYLPDNYNNKKYNYKFNYAPKVQIK